MCELLILKLNVFSNASDFSSIVWRWIHSLFNEKESSLEPQNSKNQNTFPSWFLVRKNSWRIPAGFSKFSTEIFDRDFRPYRIWGQGLGLVTLKIRYSTQGDRSKSCVGRSVRRRCVPWPYRVMAIASQIGRALSS